eukprot:TRINITY_DN6593_c1_g1_i3.p1 TRINITY_DN6593_c1_g1~~TRINITY_DN6593_c1_g1_i3.p1  ORF type:complete len:1003 (+),score=63.74 TRINITY_DN6593_c1_g1_i3:441-3449(+)
MSSWPFDDYQGRAFGARSVQDSQFPSAFQCREDEEDYIVLDTVPYAENGSFAINLWFKATSMNGFSLQYIFSHTLDSSVFNDTGEKVLIFLPENQHISYGIIRTYVHDSNDDSSRIYADSDNQISYNELRLMEDHIVVDGEWHMYTLTTHIDSTPGYQVYIDGLLAADHSLTNSGPNGQVHGGDPIYLDSDIHLCGTTDNNPDRYFDGLVSQLSLYDQALTALNIQELYLIASQSVSSISDSNIPSDLDRSECWFPFVYDGRIYSDCVLIDGRYMCESIYSYELIECEQTFTSCNTASSSGCVGEEVCAKLSSESAAVRYLSQPGHDGICAIPPVSGFLLPEGNPVPIAYFPLSGSQSSWPYEEYKGESEEDWSVDSLFGQVYDCGKHKNSYIEFSSIPYARNGQFAINIWIKARMDQFNEDYQYLYAHQHVDGYDSVGIGIYYQQVQRDLLGFVPGIFQGLSPDTLEEEDLTEFGNAWTLSKEDWHMVTLSTHKDLSPGYQIYVDGVVVVDRSENNTNSEDYVFGGNPIDLDSNILLCTSPESRSSNNFQGKIAQLSLYNTALGEEEVQALYKVVRPNADFLVLPIAGSTPINLDRRPCNFPFMFDGYLYNDCILIADSYKCMSYSDKLVECNEIQPCNTTNPDECSVTEICGKLASSSYAVRFYTQADHDGICVEPPSSGDLLPQGNPTPLAYFPLSEEQFQGIYMQHTISSWPYWDYIGQSLGAKLVDDNRFVKAFQCNHHNLDSLLLDSVPYAEKGPFAINVWMKVGNMSGDAYQYIFSQVDDVEEQRIGIYLPEENHGLYGLVRTFISESSYYEMYMDSDNMVSSMDYRPVATRKVVNGNWHMITVTTHQDMTPGVQMYIDGELVADHNEDNLNKEGIVVGGNPIFLTQGINICSRFDSNSQRYFDGRVAQLSLYDTSLSLEEVQALYKIVKPNASFSTPTSLRVGMPPSTVPKNLDRSECSFPFYHQNLRFTDCTLIDGNYSCKDILDEWVSCELL